MLEPDLDCPDCEYHKRGNFMHEFLDHLQDEHGYSHSKAFEIMQG
jgi:hypothetical protein